MNCAWVVDVVRHWIEEQPNEANRLLQQALECVPSCRDALGSAVGSGETGSSPEGTPPPSARHKGKKVEAEEPIGGGATPPTRTYEVRAEPPAPSPRPAKDGSPKPVPRLLPSPTIAAVTDTTPTRTPGIPEFKIPPPLASASEEVPRKYLTGGKPKPHLGDAEAALNGAFKQRHYGERKYYVLRDDAGARNGFALASRWEHMNPDGTANEQDRWVEDVPPMHSFSLGDYVAALFRARPGHYRVIVFVLTDKPLTQNTAARVDSDGAKRWTEGGAASLPKEIAEMDYTGDYKCTALIYEFKTMAGAKAQFVEPSAITGELHLERSGILAALEHPQPQ